MKTAKTPNSTYEKVSAVENSLIEKMMEKNPPVFLEKVKFEFLIALLD